MTVLPAVRAAATDTISQVAMIRQWVGGRLQQRRHESAVATSADQTPIIDDFPAP
jgi:hypothetical protein